MTPEADNIQFSRQIWQAVSEHAHRCLMRREFCPEQSRIENLRPVHFEEECDSHYGKQLWCFEAIGIDPVGRRHIMYGVLEFSIQYGLLEASQAALFEDADHREKLLNQESRTTPPIPYRYASTKFWICAAWASVAVLGLIWFATLINYLYFRSNPLSF